MSRKTRGHRTSGALAVAGAIALLASVAAHAAEPLPENKGVLQQFRNVRVINSPTAARTEVGPQPGLRAYIDPATGALRQPTIEEMQEAAAQSTAAASKGARLSATPMTSIVSPDGTVGMVLDDSFMQYSVVTKQPDGSLVEACVTGPEKAEEFLKNRSAVKSSRKETSNDR